MRHFVRKKDFGKEIDNIRYTMFFKKKKDMSEQNTTNEAMEQENTDKMAEGEAMEEVLSNVLNTDDSRAGTDLPDEGEDEEKDKMQAEIAELKDKYLRHVAEFENYRRRVNNENKELRQTAGREVMQALLEVLDDMERAEKQLEKATDVAQAREGMALVFGKLKHVLQQKGLRKMDAMGHDFDPDMHEAITEIPAPTDDNKGKILDVLEPGYYLGDKLIRFARVVVGK